jgi:hypothetical protein
MVLFACKFRMLVDGTADIPHPLYQLLIRVKE